LAEPRAVVTSPSPAQISGEGTLSAQEIQQVFGYHQAEIQACFQKELLHGVVVQGKIVLTWRIRPDGMVDEARVREGESSVKNAEVSSCLVRGVTGWRFRRPGGAVSVRYELLAQVVEVEPDSDRDRRERTYFRPLMPPLGGGEKGGPPRAGPCSIASGALEPSAVSALLRERWSQISACLDIAPDPPPPAADAGPVTPQLAELNRTGTFGPVPHSPPVAEWTVSAAGALSAVRVRRGADPQPKIEACLRQRLQDWRFPRTAGGDSVVSCTFLYP